ncbi:MAG: hypothetical protein IJM54_09220 [Thermoguttaceae bacterium]|nr:hypothetical protein [Thermoguttaceae bacterium]
MNGFKVIRGDGWNVFLSEDRLFIVKTESGARLVDFNVDSKLLDALRKALTVQTESSKVERLVETPTLDAPKKRTKKKTA